MCKQHTHPDASFGQQYKFNNDIFFEKFKHQLRELSQCIQFVNRDLFSAQSHTYRVGLKRIYTPYMTVCLVISLPKIPYIYMVLANPTSMYAT